MSRLLAAAEIDAALASLPGWTGATTGIRARYVFPTFTEAIAAVGDVAVEAEDADHHPDIDIRWRRVLFVLSTHSAGGVTQLDVELAHRIAAAATAHSASAEAGA